MPLDLLTWPTLLLVIGLLLLMSEVFIPSGGILGFLAISSLTAAIVLAFYQSGVTTGFWFLFVTFAAAPTVLIFAFRWWPHTPMGKRLLPPVLTSDEVLPDTAQRRTLKELVGKAGRAKTLMLPSGAVVVEGLTIDAVSDGQPIEAGQPIEVVEVRGTRVVVRPLSGEPPLGAKSDDLLSRPMDSMGFDFEDPLA